MDALLTQAYERRERLRAELRAVEGFIAEYEQLHNPESKTQESMELNFDRPAYSRGRQRRADVTIMLDAAERIIVDAGRPMSRSELVKALELAGYDVIGGDKSKVFGTNLWRSGRFKSLKGYGYWPDAYPLPAQYAEAEQRPSQIKDRP